MTKIASYLLAALLLSPAAAMAEAVIGQAAPDFSANTAEGKTVTLQDLKGKTVVLEWTNDGCPFVAKHYRSGNMQALQKELTGEGVVWAQVISSADGKQGQVDGAGANKLNADRSAAPTYVFLDPEGTMGRAYGAQTTPHMFVIDGNGTLVYKGAIDSKPSVDATDIPTATNYVREAWHAMKAGKPVATPHTKPYGCGVKYAG